MKLAKRALLIVVVLSTCVGCDQLTKGLARHTLTVSEPILFLHDLFRLQLVENQGAFLSLGATIPEHSRYWLLVVPVGLALAGMLVYLLTSRKLTAVQTIALSLVLAGGIGNWIDRILHDGRVIDFMNLGVGPLRTGIFNVADIVIVFGCCWLLVEVVTRPSIEPVRPKAEI